MALLRLVVAVALVGMVVASPAAAQPALVFEEARVWNVADTHTTARVHENPRSISLERGTLRSGEVYTDFVFRFEYRLTAPDAEASLLVRSQFEYNKGVQGYRVALSGPAEGRDAIGRVRGERQGMREVRYVAPPIAQVAGRWLAGEVRAERDRLTVSLEGVVVSESELEEFGGYLAFRAHRGGLEVRGLVVAPLPVAGEPFAAGALPVATEGLTIPTMRKRGGPIFPRGAFDDRVQGTVLLEIEIEADGMVGDIRIVRAPRPDFGQAAIASARKFRFAPATRDGVPVAVVATLEVAFNLR
jgi:TonB family protein